MKNIYAFLLFLLSAACACSAQVKSFAFKKTGFVTGTVTNPTTTPVLTLNLNEMNFPVSTPQKAALALKADNTALQAVKSTVTGFQASQATTNAQLMAMIKTMQDSLNSLRAQLVAVQSRPATVTVTTIDTPAIKIIYDSVGRMMGRYTEYTNSNFTDLRNRITTIPSPVDYSTAFKDITNQISAVKSQIPAAVDYTPSIKALQAQIDAIPNLNLTGFTVNTDTSGVTIMNAPLQVTLAQRLALKVKSGFIVNQTDEVKGLYVMKDEGWVFLK